MKILLYRVLTERDFKQNCILKSSVTKELPIYKRLVEQISHASSSNSHAGIYYSFTLELKYAIDYAKKNPKNKGIYYCEVDTDDLPKNIIGFYPTLFREYWITEFTNCAEIRMGKKILDPHYGRSRTMLGILQPSQRSVSSWCSKSKQVMLQIEGLKLYPVEDLKYDYNKDNLCGVYTSLLNMIPQIEQKKLEVASKIILEDLEKAELRNRYLEKFLGGFLEQNAA